MAMIFDKDNSVTNFLNKGKKQDKKEKLFVNRQFAELIRKNLQVPIKLYHL